MQHVGFDLGKNASQICIRAEDGELIERRIKTERESLKKLFGDRPRARILIEACTESEWVARYLEELGHQVIVADPNFAPMYATRSKKVKTDKRDARALSEACYLGAYREAHRSSDQSRQWRAHLRIRETLIRTRGKYISVISATLRQEGVHLQSGEPESILKRVERTEMPAEAKAIIKPLLEVLAKLNEQIKQADERVKELAEADPVAPRLCSLPGVGPITALTFVALIEEASRFSSAKEVRAYFGLVPRESSSSERKHRGRITKCGNNRMRYLLVEAAWSVLNSKREEARGLREWTQRIARRRGKKIAAVALARKLAGILYALWRDGSEFDPVKLCRQPSRATTGEPACALV